MLYILPRCCSCIKVLKQLMSKMKKALLPFCLIPLIATSSHAVCLESEPEKYNYQGSYGETEVKVTLESGGKKFQCKSLGKYGIEVPYYNVIHPGKMKSYIAINYIFLAVIWRIRLTEHLR